MMFDIVNAVIEKLVIHKIGSRNDNTENIYSQKCVNINEDEENPISFLLKQYFLAPFREPTLYCFDGVPDFNNNNVYKSISAIFDNPDLFYARTLVL